jgi:hypothetical protein
LREDPKPAEPAIPDAEFLPIEEREIPVPAADEPEAVLSAVLQDEPEPQTAVPEFQSWEKQVPASKARLVGISLAAILAVMVVGYLVHGRATAPSAQPAVTQGAGLALKVEKDGSTLRVSWDPNALPIKKAIRGVLSITDGIRGEHMNLSVNELESGSVIYAPMGIDVNFQLSVYASETRSVAESVRFVAPRPSPLAEPPAVKPADTKPVLATPPPAALTSRPASQPPPRATFTEPPAPAPPPVTHEAATIAPPPVEGKAAAPEAPPVAVAAKPLAATVQQPPRAIRNVQPTIPQSMKQQMVGSLTVEVRVKVDANGEVVDAVATSTNKNNKMSGYLENRSAQAARLWKFEPATLNGKKVASETTIEFKF